MCVILDANGLGQYKDPSNTQMQPVRDWLRRSGKIVYSDTDKVREEWTKGGGHNLRRELQRRNRLKLVSIQEVRQKENELKGQIESDDEHIIALAMVANVKVLVSNDKKLHQDFKNRNLVGGKIYQTARHKHLLTRDTCP